MPEMLTSLCVRGSARVSEIGSNRLHHANRDILGGMHLSTPITFATSKVAKRVSQPIGSFAAIKALFTLAT